MNHNGSLSIAKKLVDAAKRSGADCVKFQTFRAESIVSAYAPKAEYQKGSGSARSETQLEMLKKIELTIDAHRELVKYCKKKRIIFLSSPFDLDSIGLLSGLGLNIFKIPSGEITNLPYLKKIGRLKKKIIMSTGMADLKEIENAMAILAASGTKKHDITVLHCNTAYPVRMEDVNLRAMETIKRELKVDVGYSDHTIGIEIAIAAVALGASVIEKHFTLDRGMKGPDHKASIEPDELKMLVKSIRNVERALGDGVKKASKEEEKNKKAVRKSVIAVSDIPKGIIIKDNMLTVKRPGTGISPLFMDKVIGKKAKVNISKDTLIEFKDLI